MNSVNNRLGRLERDQLEAEIAKALPLRDMTDRQLLDAVLDAEGIALPAEEVDAQFPHYQLTGEVPGMPGVTIEDLVARSGRYTKDEE